MNSIESCSGASFTVRGIVYNDSSVVFPDRVVTLTSRDLKHCNVEVVLSLMKDDLRMVPIGVGGVFEQFLCTLAARFRDLGIRHEVMSVVAACDTYNVLLQESERVCAVLLLPGL
ncbi:Mth938-like domain-containing protein [Anaplasma capra]|uniref:Mth938-like domain-containing protein n=1 Tax=Anaplasma capra TaxID=1562740 RepID=UPI0021D5BAC4|nr:Mth938-like domain-containing protein [Anaplasma capra]MCU7611560.1 Mth938-like domain-containing protein [Anaplasma capra]